MGRRSVWLCSLILAIPAIVVSGAPDPRGAALLGSLPLRFEAVPGAAAFTARGRVPLLLDGAGVALPRPSAPAVRMNFEGARPDLVPAGEQPVDGQANYFVGATSGWRRHVAGYARVRYREAYPGIDVVFYGQPARLEFDVVVQPGADPGRVRFRVRGAVCRIGGDGTLSIGTGPQAATWKPPRVYQTAGGKRRPVDGRFKLDGNLVTFQVGRYDRGRELVIDPVLAYASYFGGAGNEAARALALDTAGNVYIAGYTTTNNLPVTRGSVQTAYRGQTTSMMTGDAFVAKFTPDGRLSYLTYLGGSGDDVASAIAVDSGGNAYVTGFTTSRDFPVGDTAFQIANGGAQGNGLIHLGDAFVTKLGPNGDRLVYSTFLGGSRDDAGLAIAVDAQGNACVAGTTLSTNFPVTSSAYQKNYRGEGGQPVTDFGVPFFIAGDAFIAKLNATGTALIFSTYLGGSNDDTPMAVAYDRAGNVVVAGTTISPDFPTTANAFQKTYGGFDPGNLYFHIGDGFIAKLNATGTALMFSTYLGGKGDDSITAAALDSAGNVYVTGTTTSANFPVTAGAAFPRFNGPPFNDAAERVVGDAFLAKLDAAGSTLAFATYLGGARDDAAYGIALGPDGSIYVAGQTDSENFPITADAAQRTFGGRGGQNNNGDNWGDGFLAVFDSAAKLIYATYLGGARDDSLQGVAVDASSNVYLTGSTMSANFPVTSGALQTTFGGVGTAGRLKGDALLIRFSPPPPAPPTPPPPVAPALSLDAVVNAASNLDGTVTPGMIFVGYGGNLGPKDLVGAALDSAGRLANTRAGAQILFDEVPAPLVYVSEKQVSGIVPYAVAGKSGTQAVAVYQGQRSAPRALKVAAAQPGFFSADYSGTGQGAILNQDGSYNSAANPAATGSTIVLFGTGEGQTTPPGVDGLLATSVLPSPALAVGATIGGKPAQIVYKGGAPGQVAGLFQLNLQVPADLPTGNHAVVITVGTASSLPNFTVAVQNRGQ